MMNEPFVEMKNISKQFGGIQALKNVNLCVREGEIIGLLGENGAGKSTLMNILTGVHRPDQGTIEYRGKEIELRSTQDAYRLEISIIFQELNLCPNLSAIENVFLGNERKRRGIFIDTKTGRKQALELFDTLNMTIDPDIEVQRLGVASQQMIEIARSLARRTRLLIMDEPTSSLSQKEIGNLFRVMADLKARGISIIFISHKIDEILKITDRVVMLRDGENVGELNTAEATREKLIYLMVGRSLSTFYTDRKCEPRPEKVLEVENLSGPPNVRKVSLAVSKGEILGLAGLVGAGRTEMAKLIIGAEKRSSGIIRMYGRETNIASPVEAVKNKIAYLTEDRKTLGMVLDMTTRENITISILDRLKTCLSFINRKRENAVSDEFIAKLQIKVDTREQIVKNLSGGNQQKVVIGKWLATEPEVLILDEPTRGIDVGTKAEVHRIIAELADNGVAILLISSELPEILKLSDRIMVMNEGAVTAVMSREEATQERIMEAAVPVTNGF
jgi:ABC-type sugar transport system ATPase subunit